MPILRWVDCQEKRLGATRFLSELLQHRTELERPEQPSSGCRCHSPHRLPAHVLKAPPLVQHLQALTPVTPVALTPITSHCMHMKNVNSDCQAVAARTRVLQALSPTVNATCRRKAKVSFHKISGFLSPRSCRKANVSLHKLSGFPSPGLLPSYSCFHFKLETRQRAGFFIAFKAASIASSPSLLLSTLVSRSAMASRSKATSTRHKANA